MIPGVLGVIFLLASLELWFWQGNNLWAGIKKTHLIALKASMLTSKVDNHIFVLGFGRFVPL